MIEIPSYCRNCWNSRYCEVKYGPEADFCDDYEEADIGQQKTLDAMFDSETTK